MKAHGPSQSIVASSPVQINALNPRWASIPPLRQAAFKHHLGMEDDLSSPLTWARLPTIDAWKLLYSPHLSPPPLVNSIVRRFQPTLLNLATRPDLDLFREWIVLRSQERHHLATRKISACDEVIGLSTSVTLARPHLSRRNGPEMKPFLAQIPCPLPSRQVSIQWRR